MSAYIETLYLNFCVVHTRRGLKFRFYYCLCSDEKVPYLSQFWSDLKNFWTHTPIFRSVEEILFSKLVSKMPQFQNAKNRLAAVSSIFPRFLHKCSYP